MLKRKRARLCYDQTSLSSDLHWEEQELNRNIYKTFPASDAMTKKTKLDIGMAEKRGLNMNEE